MKHSYELTLSNGSGELTFKRKAVFNSQSEAQADAETKVDYIKRSLNATVTYRLSVVAAVA